MSTTTASQRSVMAGSHPQSINKTLTTLATILELGVEYGMIDRNPAQGRRRRLRSVAPTRPWLDRADHIEALLRRCPCTRHERTGNSWAAACPDRDPDLRRTPDRRGTRTPLGGRRSPAARDRDQGGEDGRGRAEREHRAGTPRGARYTPPTTRFPRVGTRVRYQYRAALTARATFVGVSSRPLSSSRTPSLPNATWSR